MQDTQIGALVAKVELEVTRVSALIPGGAASPNAVDDLRSAWRALVTGLALETGTRHARLPVAAKARSCARRRAAFTAGHRARRRRLRRVSRTHARGAYGASYGFGPASSSSGGGDGAALASGAG